MFAVVMTILTLMMIMIIMVMAGMMVMIITVKHLRTVQVTAPTLVGIVVANLLNCLPNDLLVVNVGFGCDLSTYQDHTSLCTRLTSYLEMQGNVKYRNYSFGSREHRRLITHIILTIKYYLEI